MADAVKQNETVLIRGEVTQTPHLVERKSSKSGKKFPTAALRYWSEDEQDFGVLSTTYDLAKRVVAEAGAGTKFVASVQMDGIFKNVKDLRLL